MKILVERDPFAEAISAAMRAAGKNETIPILNHLLLTPNGNSVEIIGTCLDVQTQTKVAAEIDGPARPVTLRADALAGIVGQMPKGAQLTLECSDQTQSVIVRSGRARYKLLTLPAETFPGLMEVKEPVSFTMDGAELAACISAVKFAVARDRSRPVWQGINISVSTDEHAVFGGRRESRLVFVALDGFELARASVPLPPGAGVCPSVILPDIAIAEIIRLSTDAEQVTVSVAENLVRLSASDTEFTTKLIAGIWPNYINGVPADNDMQMIVDSDALESAVTRLRMIDDGSVHGTPLHAAIKEGTLTLSLSNQLMGDATEELEVEWNADPFEIDMRSKGLLGILDAMHSDICAVHFGRGALNGKDRNRAIIIQPWRNGAVGADRTYFTMPMQP